MLIYDLATEHAWTLADLDLVRVFEISVDKHSDRKGQCPVAVLWFCHQGFQPVR